MSLTSASSALPTSPLNRKYLRAVIDHERTLIRSKPGKKPTPSISLQAGDLILVHLTNANGWADGTILNTSVRGWFPTECCRSFDHELARPFFHGLTTVWTTASQAEDLDAWYRASEVHSRSLVLGVLYALERTASLRQSDTTGSHSNDALQRTRTGLLSDLSNYVKQTEQSATAAPDHGLLARRQVLDQHVTLAFRLGIRLVRFVDLWTRQQEKEKLLAGATKEAETFSPRDSVTSINLALPEPARGMPSDAHVVAGDVFRPVPPPKDGRKLSLGLPGQIRPIVRASDPTQLPQRESTTVLRSSRRNMVIRRCASAINPGGHDLLIERSPEDTVARTGLQKADIIGSAERRSIELSIHASGKSGSARLLLSDTLLQSLKPRSISKSSVSSHDQLEAARTRSGFGHADRSADHWYHDELVIGEQDRILGGSPRALVKYLLQHQIDLNDGFPATFFLTYQRFMTDDEFISEIMNHCQSLRTTAGLLSVQENRVFDVLDRWLDNLCAVHDYASLERLQEFIDQHCSISGRHKRLSHGISAMLEMKRPPSEAPKGHAMLEHEDQSCAPVQRSVKDSMCFSNLMKRRASGPSIIDFEPLEIAQQLTLFSSDVFLRITPQELLSTTLTKSRGNAPHIKAMTRLSTTVTHLVSLSIVLDEDSGTRAAVVEQWLRVAQACLDMSNHDTLMAIMSSLNSAAILRLNNTWPQVSPAMLTRLKELQDVTNVARNFAGMRRLLKSPERPCLPFLGMFLTDLTFVEAGNADRRVLPHAADTLDPIEVVNFDKYTRMSDVIRSIRSYQYPFSFSGAGRAKAFLKTELDLVADCEEDGAGNALSGMLYQQSLTLEPQPGPRMENRGRPLLESDANLAVGARRTGIDLDVLEPFASKLSLRGRDFSRKASKKDLRGNIGLGLKYPAASRW